MIRHPLVQDGHLFLGRQIGIGQTGDASRLIGHRHILLQRRRHIIGRHIGSVVDRL